MILAVLLALSIQPKDEVATALRAAPPRLRDGAGVFVLRHSGFVRVRPSRNGFNCLVERGRNSIAPVCYDAVGSRSTLLASLEQAQLAARGVPSDRIAVIVDRDYRTGRLQAPQRPGIAYMLSNQFVRIDPRTGRSTPIYPPHVMIYAPYLTNAELGVPPAQVKSTTHVWVEAEGRPDACIVIPQTSHA